MCVCVYVLCVTFVQSIGIDQLYHIIFYHNSFYDYGRVNSFKMLGQCQFFIINYTTWICRHLYGHAQKFRTLLLLFAAPKMHCFMCMVG